MHSRLLPTVLVAALASALPTATTLAVVVDATYTFANIITADNPPDTGPEPTASNLTFGDFQSTLSGTSTGNGRYSLNGWGTGAPNFQNNPALWSGSIDLAKFYEVTITPAPGFTLALNSITFAAQRSSGGVRNYSVRSDLDSFAANLPASTGGDPDIAVDTGNIFRFVDDSTLAGTSSTITLGTEFDNLTTAVTFQFYGWNGETPATSSNFSIDTVRFQGELTPVPEPGAYALAIGAALAGWAGWRVRSRRA